MTFELIHKIRRYLEANMKFFKVNANGIPSVKSVEQLILILLVTSILKLTHQIVTV